MKKKIISVFLMLGIVNFAMITASAAGIEGSSLKLSVSGTKFIERHEGFSKFEYKYSTQSYIGYGTKCEAGEYPNGISEEEAEALLITELSATEASVTSFLDDHGIAFAQYQFDALVSFTYDLGTGWMNSSSRIYNYLIDGINNHSSIEIINAIGTWCHEGKKVNTRLVERRLAEAKLFLFGDYEGITHDYKYLIFNAGDGIVDHNIIFYESGFSYGQLPEAKLDGQVFAGWYTLNGTRIDAGKIAEEDLTVNARWINGSTPEATRLYPDVNADDWFYTYVSELSSKGVIGGCPDGTFQPKRYVSCGEALKLILLSAGYNKQDAVDGNWASGYLKLAVTYGFIDSKEITDLDSPISRLLIAKITAKALDLAAPETATPFADTSDRYVLTLYQYDIVKGINDNGVLTYKPNELISRAEISAIVWRISNSNVHDNQVRCGSHWVDILENVPTRSCNVDCFFAINGIMHYESEGVTTCTGIDVSSFQGKIDWQKVKASGIDFAIIRLGFRGYETGIINLDSYFEYNIREALNAGLAVGVYFFSQAITVEEAEAEAEFVLSYIKEYEISYPVVFDWENISSSTARTSGLKNETLNQCALAFCNRIVNAGYSPMIYFNTYIGYMKYDLSKIHAFDFWLAEYTDKPDFYYDFQMWQYTSSGIVAGISGSVDMNICFVSFGQHKV